MEFVRGEEELYEMVAEDLDKAMECSDLAFRLDWFMEELCSREHEIDFEVEETATNERFLCWVTMNFDFATNSQGWIVLTRKQP